MPNDAFNLPALGSGEVWNAERLWIQGGEPRREMVSSFIAHGDLVILAGPPKSGKSLLASQLCLELLRGNGHLFGHPSLKIHPAHHQRPAWRVLFVSLEMEPDAIWGRVARQAEKLGISILDLPRGPTRFASARPHADHKPNPKHSPLPYFHAFQINGEKSLSISRREGRSGVSLSRNAAKSWRAIIDETHPDVIVLDSLSQLHDCDENSNIDMRHVLHELTRLCDYQIAGTTKKPTKIIIHHTRKPNGDRYRGASTAIAIRGASSIHAEADLAITITKAHSARHAREAILSCSSRHAAQIDDFSVEREDVGLTFTYVGAETSRYERRFREQVAALHQVLFSAKHALTQEEIAQAVAPLTRDHGKWARAMVRGLATTGLLIKSGRNVKGSPSRYAVPTEQTRDRWISLALNGNSHS